MKMKIKMKKDLIQKIKIRDIKKLKNKTLRVSVVFDTELCPLVIKGFRVSMSMNYEGHWVQPPSVRIYGKYMELFYAESPEIWEFIKDLLIDLYDQHYPDTPENSGEKINVDEVIKGMEDKDGTL